MPRKAAHGLVDPLRLPQLLERGIDAKAGSQGDLHPSRLQRLDALADLPGVPFSAQSTRQLRPPHHAGSPSSSSSSASSAVLRSNTVSQPASGTPRLRARAVA